MSICTQVSNITEKKIGQNYSLEVSTNKEKQNIIFNQ